MSGFSTRSHKSPTLAYGFRPYEVGLELPNDLEIKHCKLIRCVPSHNSLRKPVAISPGCHLQGCVFPKGDYTDSTTMLAGVCVRFARKPPSAKRSLLRGLLRFVKRYVHEHYVPLSSDCDQSVETWLETTSYSRKRKDDLLKLSLLQLPLNSDIGDEEYFVKSFPKDEHYKSYKVLRAINSRTDEFKVRVGPIFKLIEQEVFKDDKFIKHIPVQDRPKYIYDKCFGPNKHYVETDYTAFESLFTREIMSKVEFVLYEHMVSKLPNGGEFMKTIRRAMLGINHCRFKTLTIEVPATRMSGEMCTSLGNGFSNLMFMLYACHINGNVDIDGVVEGDDGLFSSDLPMPDIKIFEDMGLRIKYNIVDKLSEASFCGLIFDEVDMINITDPIFATANFGWLKKVYLNVSEQRQMALLKAKSMSMLAQYPGCPILQELALYGMRVTKNIKMCKVIKEINRPYVMDEYQRDKFLKCLETSLEPKPVGMRTRQLMESKFGILIEHQLRAEQILKGLSERKVFDLGLSDYYPADAVSYHDQYCVHTRYDYLYMDPGGSELRTRLLCMFSTKREAS